VRRLWLAASLLLAACAPTQSSPPDGATFTLTTGTYQTLNFDAGPAPALGGVAFLYGSQVRVNDTRCSVDGAHLRCLLGEVLPGKPKTIYASGVTTGRVEYGRGDGRVRSVELK
jgi:hypothetical protein